MLFCQVLLEKLVDETKSHGGMFHRVAFILEHEKMDPVLARTMNLISVSERTIVVSIRGPKHSEKNVSHHSPMSIPGGSACLSTKSTLDATTFQN